MTVARAARLLPDGDNVVSVDGGKLNERFDETSTLVRRTPTAARPPVRPLPGRPSAAISSLDGQSLR